MDKTSDGDSVIITGGEGVGKITKPGLQIPVGEYAINPVPRRMIRKNLERILPEDKVAKVTISIPEGQIDVALALNLDNLVFVPGNIGEKLALKQLDITKQHIIQTGNYVGFMFEEAKKRGIDEFTFFGHIGKLIKIAGGIFNTKHAIADGRREIMITHAGICGADTKTLQKLYDSKTTEDMLDILDEENLHLDVCNSIALAIKERCMQRFDLDLNVILVDMEGNYLNDNFERFLL